MTIDETGVDEMTIDETGVDEIGIDETVVDETGVDETGVDEIGINPAAGVGWDWHVRLVTCMLLITANSFSLNSLSAIYLHFNSLR